MDQIKCYTPADEFQSGDTPTAATWNENVFELPNAGDETRWSLSRGFYVLPTLTADPVGLKVDVSIAEPGALLDGKLFAGDDAWMFTGASAGTYYLQMMADGALSKSTTEDTDYLTFGTAVWTGSAFGTLTRTATVGIRTTGSTGDVTGPASSTDDTLAVFSGPGGKTLKASTVDIGDVADAVAALHDQNTDTGTDSTTWFIGGTLTGFQFSGGVPQYTTDGGANWTNFPVSSSGYVVGPASSTDGYLCVYNGTSGKIIKVLALSGAAVIAAVDIAHEHANADILDQVLQSLIDHPAELVADNPHGIDATAAEWNAAQLQGVDVDDTEPGVSDVLVYDGTKWAPGAISVDADGFAAAVHAADGKTTPVDGDEVGIADSGATYGLKKVTWANVKATLKTYFDTVYATAAGLVPATRTVNGHALSADVTVSKTDVGLGNVTDDAQVKKISSSTDNAITRWDSTTGALVQNSGATVDDSDNVKAKQFYNVPPTVTPSAGAATIDFNSGLIQKVTVNAAPVTLTFSNAVAGQKIILELTQDVSGSRTITWPAAVRWAGGTAPTLTATASKTDVIGLFFDGTYYLGAVYAQNYTLA